MPLNRNQFYGLYGQMTAPRTILPPPPQRTAIIPGARSAYPMPPVPRPRPIASLPPVSTREGLRSTVGPMLRPPVRKTAQPSYGHQSPQRRAFPRGQRSLITAFLRGY